MLPIDISKISADQSYKDALSQLMEEWSHAKTNKELIDSIIFASQNYMLTKEIWDYTKDIAQSEPEFYEKQKLVESLVKPAYFQFYYNFPFYVDFRYRKDLNWFDKDGVYDVPEKYANFCFSFPHKSLDIMWKHYCEHINAPPPKSILNSYKRMKKLYDEIIEVEEDTEKWYEILKQVDDDTIIEHNLEYRLGLDLSDKKLWKIYMDFLEARNKEKLFQAYAKYCNFFIDDIEMKIKFNEMAIKYEYFVPENVFMPVEPEGISDDQIWDENCYIYKSVPPTCYYNIENRIIQNFSFKNPILNYVIRNAKGETLQKLFKTCKLFYSYFPAQICYKFDFGRFSRAKHLSFEKESIHVSNFLPEDNFHQIIILNSFHLSGDKSINHLSKSIIPKLYKCEAKHINIQSQKFNFDEFEMIVGHGNIVNLDLAHVEIVDNKTGEICDAADILNLTPKVEFICLINMHYTIQTTQKLLEISFQNKIQEIVSSFSTSEIEPFAFAQFLMKNISSTCELFIGFEALSNEASEHFFTVVNDCIDEYWPGKYKPHCECI